MVVSWGRSGLVKNEMVAIAVAEMAVETVFVALVGIASAAVTRVVAGMAVGIAFVAAAEVATRAVAGTAVGMVSVAAAEVATGAVAGTAVGIVSVAAAEVATRAVAGMASVVTVEAATKVVAGTVGEIASEAAVEVATRAVVGMGDGTVSAAAAGTGFGVGALEVVVGIAVLGVGKKAAEALEVASASAAPGDVQKVATRLPRRRGFGERRSPRNRSRVVSDGIERILPRSRSHLRLPARSEKQEPFLGAILYLPG
jgi:hypothetical protein